MVVESAIGDQMKTPENLRRIDDWLLAFEKAYPFWSHVIFIFGALMVVLILYGLGVRLDALIEG